ncbi:MAG TPA: CAP domain-containing protein [Gemmataceae bacterium]|jgi:uncharacterized protein YkwD|nr:CAP domain-containing protein [Gemmataceae bacterium]
MTSGCIDVLKVGLAVAFLCFLSGFDDEEKAALDRDEARKAFDYLNRIRKEPAKFSKEIGIDLENVKARPALKWNGILAKVAEEKALDMANRDYFGHVTPEGRGINIQIHEAGYALPKDWLKEKDQNFFESISAGTNTGEEAIRNLIVDKDLAAAPHRNQLLGITDFYAECTDIGIGFARNPKSKYRTYMSIIIARKK